MRPDLLQQRRFELKYRVKESTAAAIRAHVRSHLVPDEYAAGQPDHAYAVHSLYLDSADLRLYHATLNGDRNRYKLRLRYYDDAANAPVFFEIKRREDHCIHKQRAAVRRSALHALLAGRWPGPADLFGSSPRQLLDLQEFSRLLQHVRARPQARVIYRREAWMSPWDNSARVTFDRDVRSLPHRTEELTLEDRGAVRPFGEEVIFEIKYTDRMPAWAAELVHVFELVQSGAAKYVEGLHSSGATRPPSPVAGHSATDSRQFWAADRASVPV
ncbi:polyphosphate polymerase domain-containing protein [Opitutus sp. ER46]|uniref:polyphosphate polymerase domain-containing protein n=1 Tax=Opitutus sp. ER46 TaxID=2161864 RepID=UPI0013049AC6|nr:polyphosphate polymerase domain-containing protein [Opitutus sp. ER46]